MQQIPTQLSDKPGFDQPRQSNQNNPPWYVHNSKSSNEVQFREQSIEIGGRGSETRSTKSTIATNKKQIRGSEKTHKPSTRIQTSTDGSIDIPVGDEVDAVGGDGFDGGGGGGGEVVEGAFGRVHGRMRAEESREEAAEAAEEAHNETGEAPDSAGEINLGRIFRRRRGRV